MRRHPCVHAGRLAALDIDRSGCIDVSDVLLATVPAGRDATPSARVASAPATWTVTDTADDADVAAGDGVCATASGVCTLRAALREANLHPGRDRIVFDIPGSGVRTIQLTKPLPTINDMSGGVTIDGYSQPGAAPNTDPARLERT